MLKITLASGQVQEVPFTQASTLTVTNQGFVDGVATPVTASFSEIEDLEITADPVVVQPDLPSQAPPEPPAPTSGLPVDTNAGTEPTSGDVPVSTSNAFATPDNTSAGNDAQNPVVTQASSATGLDAVTSGDVPADPDAAVDEPSEPPAPDTSNPQVDELAQTPGETTVDTTVPVQPDTVGGALAAADAAGETVTEPTDGTPVQDGSTQVDAEGNPAPADSSPPEALGTVIANAGAVVDAAVNDPAAHIDHLAQAQTDVNAALNTWPDDPNLLDLKTQLDDLAADASEAANNEAAQAAQAAESQPPAAA